MSLQRVISLRLILFVVLLTAGCTTGITPPNPRVPTGIPPTGVWVSVSCDNPWEGTVVVDGRTSSVSGQGTTWIDISDDADFVTVRVTKLDGSPSRLEADIWESGQRVAGQYTDLPNGTVQVVQRFE